MLNKHFTLVHIVSEYSSLICNTRKRAACTILGACPLISLETANPSDLTDHEESKAKKSLTVVPNQLRIWQFGFEHISSIAYRCPTALECPMVLYNRKAFRMS